MVDTIAVGEIAERARQRRRQKLDGVDVWVRLGQPDDPGRRTSGEAIRRAIGRIAGAAAWSVRPTSAGTYVWIRPADDWRPQIEALAADLQADHAVSITAPPTSAWAVGTSLEPAPSAMLAFTVDPPATAGPFNIYGVPERRWGVPAPVTEDFLRHACAWALQAGDRLVVGSGSVFFPVGPADVLDIVTQFLDEKVTSLHVHCRDSNDTVTRTMRLMSWGRVVLNDLDTERDHEGMALELRDLVVGLADVVDYAAVGLARSIASDNTSMTTPLWDTRPDLQATYVPKPNAIQVLTPEHLHRAHDLSGWDVQQVGVDRSLVSARDLTPWFGLDDPQRLWTGDFPDTEIREAAATDFGEMTLTREASHALPRTGPA